jgi:Tfp pilus assembly protein PilF
LEKAVQMVPENRNIHRTLATVYSQLGMPEVAERHTRLAAENASAKP